MTARRPHSVSGGRDSTWLKTQLHIAAAVLGNSEHGAIVPLATRNDDLMARLSGCPASLGYQYAKSNRLRHMGNA